MVTNCVCVCVFLPLASPMKHCKISRRPVITPPSMRHAQVYSSWHCRVQPRPHLASEVSPTNRSLQHEPKPRLRGHSASSGANFRFWKRRQLPSSPSGNPCAVFKPRMAGQACSILPRSLSFWILVHVSPMHDIPIGLPTPIAVAIYRDSLIILRRT